MDSGLDSSVADSSDCTAVVPLRRVGSGGSGVVDAAPDLPLNEADSAAGGAKGGGFQAHQKLPSSRFKGVVPQPNGRWGAQIYERHQRVWLGTFASEEEAAKSYDAAAQRFRGRDAVTNYRTLADAAAAGDADAAAEMRFLSSKSKAEVVDMLRKHTYADELSHSKRYGAAASKDCSFAQRASCTAAAREHLFDKAVTPSDVGKLNRLVIPKQHAEKHFPLQPSDDVSAAAGESKGVLLNFEDSLGKVWRFRYSYWNSSQSYVLTKGWSRFVKEKSLSAGDVVGFYRSCGPEKQMFIDCKQRASTSGGEAAITTPAPKAVRLFGVDLTRASTPAMPTAVREGGSCEEKPQLCSAGKRSSAGAVDMGMMMKKQCIAAVV